MWNTADHWNKRKPENGPLVFGQKRSPRSQVKASLRISDSTETRSNKNLPLGRGVGRPGDKEVDMWRRVHWFSEQKNRELGYCESTKFRKDFPSFLSLLFSSLPCLHWQRHLLTKKYMILPTSKIFILFILPTITQWLTETQIKR